MVYVFFAFFLIYILLMLTLLAGWQVAVTEEKKIVSEPETHFLSVIVPFRNESRILKTLINSLREQDYTSFEVILVDDASTDDSVHIISGLTRNDNRFKLLPNRSTGKKQALSTGINFAKGTIIVTTDADCHFGTTWLSNLNLAFQDDSVKLAFGPVRIDTGDTPFAKLQAMEFATVIGTGVASFGLKKPVFCNGANLAFRQSTFSELGGYQGNLHIPSGDDTFFFEKVLKQYPSGIRFTNSTDSVVTTQPQAGIKDFYYQRLRWAGKWRYSGNMNSCGMAMFMFFFQCMIIILYGWLLSGDSPRMLAILMSMKLLLDYVLIFNVSTFLRQKVSLWNFVILQIFYPFYVVAVGLGTFFIKYTWKGRRLGH